MHRVGPGHCLGPITIWGRPYPPHLLYQLLLGHDQLLLSHHLLPEDFVLLFKRIGLLLGLASFTADSLQFPNPGYNHIVNLIHDIPEELVFLLWIHFLNRSNLATRQNENETFLKFWCTFYRRVRMPERVPTGRPGRPIECPNRPVPARVICHYPLADLPEPSILYLGFGKKQQFVKKQRVNNKTPWGCKIWAATVMFQPIFFSLSSTCGVGLWDRHRLNPITGSGRRASAHRRAGAPERVPIGRRQFMEICLFVAHTVVFRTNQLHANSRPLPLELSSSIPYLPP